MTPDEREALVKRMAEVIAADSPCQMKHSEAMSVALAALAVAEPVVRADAAKVLDARVAEIRSDQAYWSGPDTTNGAVLIPELEARAAAIRARGAA